MRFTNSRSSVDTQASVATLALVGWLVCQVGLILVLPGQNEQVQSFFRVCVLAAYWLTFGHAFRLRIHAGFTLGVCVVGFEWLVDLWCGVPFSKVWLLVGLVWMANELDLVTKHRVQSLVLDRCYALLCASVYATTTTRRLQRPYFRRFHRTLARVCETLRRACAHKLSSLKQNGTRHVQAT